MNTKPKPDKPPPAEPDGEERKRVEQDAQVDLEGEQSFPASDPPSWTLGAD
jgi:hypothetical protein